jgi:hypothetical protein
VLAHDRLNSLGGLVGVVEGDCADVVVEYVGLDDAVEELSSDEAELAVNGSRGSANVGPGLAIIMGKGRISMLKVGNGNLIRSVFAL